MTDLRTAAKQALEALEAGPDVDPIFAGETEDALRAALVEDAMQKFTDVNQELEAALAEPVEPVAWTHINGTSDTKRHQPQRKPLTEEAIDALDLPLSGTATVRDFVRIIERAHGIT